MKQFRIIVIALLLASAAPFAQVSAEVALRAAMEKETVDGDLKGAIEAYRKIVDGYPDNRAVRAQALLRMAECYQKSGDAQAVETYRRILREFSDQTAQASVARTRVSQPSARAEEFTIRRVDSSETGVDDISTDGTKVAFTDWDTGNIAVRELGAAQNTRITTQTTYDEFGEMPVFSPDGTQVAYTWCTTSGAICLGYLHVARAAAGQGASARVVFARETWTQAYDWSPDGKYIAAVVTKKDKQREIAVIAVADGAIRTLKIVDGGTPRRMLYSPDGKYLAFDTGRPTGAPLEFGASDVFVIAVADGSERPVAVDPADSLLAGWSPDGSRLLFTSDSGGTVDLYAATISANEVQGRPVLVRPNLGAITPLRIGRTGAFHYSTQSGGGSHIGQATIDFSAGLVTAGGTASALDGGIGLNRGPQWSRDGQWLAYVHRRAATPQTRSSIMIRAAAPTGETRELRPDLTTVQQLHWSRDGRSIYTIGVDGRGAGGLFRVDVTTGAASLVVAADLLSHLRMSVDGTRTHFFSSTAERHRLIEYDIATDTQKELFGFDAPGVPSAFQLSPDGSKVYYRRPHARPAPGPGAPAAAGLSVLLERDLVSGSERELAIGRIPFMLLSPDGTHVGMRRVDPEGKWSAVAVLPTTGDPIIRDLMRLEQPGGANLAAWAPDGKSLLINKPAQDASKSETWWVPIAGGAAKQLARFMGNIHVHPDGRQVAFQFGSDVPARTEVFAMEHFLPPVTAR
jgi:Tol biopolymer transport system component